MVRIAIVAVLLVGCFPMPRADQARGLISRSFDKFTGKDKVSMGWMYLGMSNGVHVNMSLDWNGGDDMVFASFRMGKETCPASFSSKWLAVVDGERMDLAYLDYHHLTVNVYGADLFIATSCIGMLSGHVSATDIRRIADGKSAEIRVGQAELALLPNHRKSIKEFLASIERPTAAGATAP